MNRPETAENPSKSFSRFQSLVKRLSRFPRERRTDKRAFLGRTGPAPRNALRRAKLGILLLASRSHLADANAYAELLGSSLTRS
jgi:hypothetical protein